MASNLINDNASASNDSPLTWGELPLVPLLRIFSYLGTPSDIAGCGRVNRHWYAVSQKEEPWKDLVFRDWRIGSKQDYVRNHQDNNNKKRQLHEVDAKEEGSSFKNIYSEMHLRFKSYISCYARVKGVWNRIDQWLQLHSPPIYQTLSDGATTEELATLTSHAEQPLHLDLETRCSYLIRNGQLLDQFERPDKLGLFGGYKFYDHIVNMSLMPLEVLKDNYQAFQKSRIPWLRHCVPIVRSFNNLKILFLVVKEFQAGQLHLQPGWIIEACQQGDLFLVARSFVELLEDLANNLESGNYSLGKTKQIVRYPCRNVPSAVTRGVKITAAPLWILERSSLNPPSFLFAYRIRMEMDSKELESRTCQLANRHWEIVDGNNAPEVVDGPGVIGKYPKMYPGASFEYASCCPIRTPSGKMGGWFGMVVSATRETFDAVVPEFQFVAPVGQFLPK